MNRRSILIWLNITFLVLSWAMALSSYGDLPDRIPVHFDFKGQPDRWAEKSPFNFFGITAIQTGIVLLILILRRYPRFYNFPQKQEIKDWPEKYRRPIYEFLEFAILVIALILNLFFMLMQKMIIGSVADGHAGGAWPWLMIPMVLIWLPILAYILIKVNKIVAFQKTEMAGHGHRQNRQ